MTDMPSDMLNSFIQVFQQLPQRVIWQWKSSKGFDLGDNIMTVDWLPQQDLLGNFLFNSVTKILCLSWF